MIFQCVEIMALSASPKADGMVAASRKRRDHPRVSDKLARVKSPEAEALDLQTTEGQKPRRPWGRAFREGVGTIGDYVKAGVGEGVGIVGDYVKARFGENADPLRERLKKIERKIAKPSGEDTKQQPPTPTSPPPAPMEYEVTSIAFMERIAVALHLTHLVQEVMAPGGWSHTVRLPIERAQQLLNSLEPLLGEGSGWEKTVSSCYGFIANIERAALELNRLDRPADVAQDAEEESQERRAKIKAHLTEAQIAMAELRTAIGKLVTAAHAFRTGEPSP